MGCSENDWYCDNDEYPIHEVNLSAFYIDRSEVTVSKYGECVTAAKCTEARDDLERVQLESTG